MKEQILKRLLEAQDYVSGEELSLELGVTRTAIWKAINNLKKDGYGIKSQTNKGYRLVEHSQRLTYEAVHLALDFFEKIWVYDTIDSTNNEIKRLQMNESFSKGLVLSEEQVAGKGRRGRLWFSQKESGLYMSMLLKPSIKPVQASMLTLVAGLTVCQMIQNETQLEAKIKWPNDIVINGKKVCGILTEMNSEIEDINYVVVGVGINVNQERFPDEIATIASSLRIEGNKNFDRLELLKSFMGIFKNNYEQFLIDGDLSSLQVAYNERCINVNQALKLIETHGEREVKGLGINVLGELLVENEAGKVELVRAGEVSVRGLYGYI